MNDNQRKSLHFFMRNLAWLMVGVASTAIPLCGAALLLIAGVQRELAVVICFGLCAICAEHAMNKIVRKTNLTNLMNNAAKFLGCAAAYVLSAPYVARNLCLMGAPDEQSFAQIASVLVVIVVAFQTAWLFQNLVNTEAK